MTASATRQDPRRRSAESVWDRSTPATSAHAYIQSQRGFADGLRVLPEDDDLTINGEPMAGSLVVPCWRPDGRLASLQFVKLPESPGALPSSDKLTRFNLPGASMDGYFPVGQQSETGSTYIVDNIAAAWAVHRASRCRALVLFATGRLGAFVQFLRNKGETSLVIALRKDCEKQAMNVAQRERVSFLTLPASVSGDYDLADFALEHGDEALIELLASAQMPKARFKLLSSDDLKLMPPIEWCVRGVIPAKGLAAIFGASGSGKSFLALDLAAAIAAGRRWFGCRVEAAPVVYVALEGEAGFRVRVEAWEKHHQERMPKAISFLLDQFKLAAGCSA